MKVDESPNSIRIEFDDITQSDVGLVFMGMGLAAIVMSVSFLADAGTFTIVGLVCAAIGAGIFLTRQDIVTTVSKSTGLVVITYNRRFGNNVDPVQLHISRLKNIEYAQFRYGANTSSVGRVIYLNTIDGERIRIAAQQNSRFPWRKAVTEQEIRSAAKRLSDFTSVPLDDNPNTARPIST